MISFAFLKTCRTPCNICPVSTSLEPNALTLNALRYQTLTVVEVWGQESGWNAFRGTGASFPALASSSVLCSTSSVCLQPQYSVEFLGKTYISRLALSSNFWTRVTTFVRLHICYPSHFTVITALYCIAWHIEIPSRTWSTVRCHTVRAGEIPYVILLYRKVLVSV